MASHSHFHRKKIDRNLLIDYTATKQIAFGCDEYGEKATLREKLFKWTAGFRRNVTYFAGNLCSARSKWRDCVHSQTKVQFTLFYPN
jgi:hypothetical protein